MSAPFRLSDEQRLDWLQLLRCENIVPRTFHTLLNRHGGAAQALAALPALIRQGKGRTIVLARREVVLREMEAADRLGARFVALGEADYPPLLREIDSPPPLLALRGRADVLQRPMVALVGSRNASAAGLAMTERLARGWRAPITLSSQRLKIFRFPRDFGRRGGIDRLESASGFDSCELCR